MNTTTAMLGSLALGAIVFGANCARSSAGVPMEASDEVAKLVGNCPNLMFSAKGMRVTTDAATEFKDGSCAEVINGKDVEIEGVARDGVLYAKVVQLD